MAGSVRNEAPWHAWLARSQGWHMIDEIDLVALIAVQSDWLNLSAQLERLADHLPSGLSDSERASTSARLRRLADAPQDAFVKRADALLGESAKQPLATSLIAHVTARHAGRIVQAYDLIEALDPPAGSRPRIGADTLGYMLRCFFDGCRQIVALERLTLLELAGGRLTSAARALLTERIIECCDTA